MHILQMNTEKGWRGGERQTFFNLAGLRDVGIQATLLCLKDRPLYKRATAAGFDVVGVFNQLHALWYCISKGRRYSVMHAQSSRIFGFAAVATLVVKTPLVYTRRVDFVPRGVLTRWKYHRATALVAISEAISTILKTSGMGSAEVISSIVSEYVPDQKRSAVLHKKLQLEGMRVVGVIAALVGHKDPLTMVRAAHRVVQTLPGTVFIHFGDGPLHEAVIGERQRLGLKQQYHVVGFHDTVEDYFTLFNCFAMSSREEGLGSTVLDAFRLKVPVASTAAGGLVELVTGRGLLSPVGDADALADNIICLLVDSKFRRGLVDKAAAYVKEHHSREVLIQRYLNLYRKVAVK